MKLKAVGETSDKTGTQEKAMLCAILQRTVCDIKLYDPDVVFVSDCENRARKQNALDAVDWLLDEGEEAYSSNHMCDYLGLNKTKLINGIKKEDAEKWKILTNARNADSIRLEEKRQLQSGVIVGRKWKSSSQSLSKQF